MLRGAVGPRRRTEGVKPGAVKAASPVLNGGDEETGFVRPRLVATQLESDACNPKVADPMIDAPQRLVRLATAQGGSALPESTGPTGKRSARKRACSVWSGGKAAKPYLSLPRSQTDHASYARVQSV